MKYQLQLTREHSVLKNENSSGPLIQYTHLELDSTQDEMPVSAAQLMGAIEGTIESTLTADAAIPAEGWLGWQPMVLRDAYQFQAEPVLQMFPTTPVIRHINSALQAHPRTYGVEDWAGLRVLVDWLFSATPGSRHTWLPSGTLSVSNLGAEPLLTFEDANQKNWSAGPLLPVPVKLPVVSFNCRAFNLPPHLERSYLIAFYQTFEFLLNRPLWENNTFSPKDWAEHWTSDSWRLAAMADGAAQRVLVLQAYLRLIEGPHRSTLKAMGFLTPLAPLEPGLPPRARGFAAERFAEVN